MNWNDVEKAVSDSSLYEADLDTLHQYLRAATNAPPSHNDARHQRVSQALHTIHFLISQKENEIQQQENYHGIKQSVHWAKVAGVCAVLSVVVGILFGTASMMPRNSQHSPPTPNSPEQIQLPQSITNVVPSSSSSNSPPNKNLSNHILDPTWTTPVLKAKPVSQAGQD